MSAPERFPLAVLPTPLVPAGRINAALGVGDTAPLLVKRDDLIGFAAAGNKARPLEYLVGAARRAGAEVLVTGGGPGSNFCAAAAVAARVAGLRCELVMWGDPDHRAPNVAVALAAGARIIPTGRDDRDEVDVLAAERAAELTRGGTRAVAVPRGGSTPTGALGFADAAVELAGQLRGVSPAAIVVPVGSGGSCGGLLAGLAACGLDVPVLGVSVSRPPDAVRCAVLDLAARCAALRGTAAPVPEQLQVVDARGPGFGHLTERERELARLALHAEGFLLDATYGAEAFAAAADLLLTRPRGPVVWWHTGGVAPALQRLTTDLPAPLDEGAGR